MNKEYKPTKGDKLIFSYWAGMALIALIVLAFTGIAYFFIEGMITYE